MPPGELIVVPHLRGPDLERFRDLRMETGQILQRLGDPIGEHEGAPPLRVVPQVYEASSTPRPVSRQWSG